MRRKHSLVALIVTVLFSLSSITTFAFTLTSPFGWRTHPISKFEQFHKGIDLGEEFGTPIPVVRDGVVYAAGEYDGYGNMVLIQHDENNYTLYAHCSEIFVEPGQTVNYGQSIAAVGSSGYSTGPHLHLEWWHEGHYANPELIWPW